jgi:hypothetical protein
MGVIEVTNYWSGEEKFSHYLCLLLCCFEVRAKKLWIFLFFICLLFFCQIMINLFVFNQH